jgi:hypothetical protein
MAIGEITDTIENFKTKLGAGARSNYFRVSLSFPKGVDTGLETPEEDFSILCTAAVLPGTKPVETEDLNFFGETMKIDNGKGPSEPVTFTFKNTEDMKLRKAFEKWKNLIQAKKTGVRGAPEEYKVNNIYIAQLDRFKKPTYQVKLVGFFPTETAQLDLTNEEKAVSGTEITCAYDYWEEVE